MNKVQSLRGLGELTSLVYLKASDNNIPRLSKYLIQASILCQENFVNGKTDNIFAMLNDFSRYCFKVFLNMLINLKVDPFHGCRDFLDGNILISIPCE